MAEELGEHQVRHINTLLMDAVRRNVSTLVDQSSDKMLDNAGFVDEIMNVPDVPERVFILIYRALVSEIRDSEYLNSCIIMDDLPWDVQLRILNRAAKTT